MTILLRFFILFFTFNFIFSNQLTFSNAEINAGETASIELSLDNPNDIIGGFQFQITDLPNQGIFSDVQATERTSGFQVQFNEQEDGSVIVVGFDLTLQGVQSGSGPILNLFYESTNIYTSEITISMVQDVSILSDLVGLPIEYTLTDGNIVINGEDPPPIVPIENLSATSGFGTITLFWSDPNTVEIEGYHIFRDNNLIGESTSTNYTDDGLQQGTEYCYTVTAFNENNESDQSDSVCAVTEEIELEAPPNLTAVVVNFLFLI